MKKIGIIGSGDVGRTLGKGFIKHGYQVKIGTSKPNDEKVLKWVADNGPDASAGLIAEATGFGDILVLAVKGTAAKEVVQGMGAPALAGKIIIDVTNPIDPAPPDNGVLRYFTTVNRSLMEDLQQLAPDAHFVKAFNSIGNAFMVNPQFAGGKPTMFICGNSEDAKKEVSKILDQFGWEVENMGKVEGARAIEPLCMLWCIPGMLRNEWTHAFKLLK